MLLVGFPPIGCLPAQITLFGSVGQKGCVEDLNQISIAYNNRLKAAIPKLESSLPGLRLLYGDAYTYIYEAFNNPSKYGEHPSQHQSSPDDAIGCLSLDINLPTRSNQM